MPPPLTTPLTSQLIDAVLGGVAAEDVVAVWGDEEDVLDADAADVPVAVENVEVEEPPVLAPGAQEIRLDVRPAEVQARLYRHHHPRLQNAEFVGRCWGRWLCCCCRCW